MKVVKKITPLYLYPFLLLLAFIYQSPFNPSPYFYAEDGYYLFRESIELGWQSIFIKLIGTFLLLPRIIAYLATTFLPIKFAPIIFPIVTALIGTLVISWFSRPGFRWIIKNDLVRIILCFIFILLPGANTLLVTLCTLNWFLFLGILLLLIEKNDENMFFISNSKIIVISFMILSSPQSIILLPLMIFLGCSSKDKKYLLLILTLLIQAYINFNGSIENSSEFPIINLSIDSIYILIRVFFDNLLIRGLFLPLLGSLSTTILELPIFVIYLIGLTILISFFYFIQKHVKEENTTEFYVASISFFSVFMLLPLAYIVRFYTREILLLPLPVGLGERYSYLPALVVLVFYAACLEKISLRRSLFKYLLSIYIMLNMRGPADSYSSKYNHLNKVNLGWLNTANEIEAALVLRKHNKIKQPIKINIYCQPPQWKDCHNPIIIK